MRKLVVSLIVCFLAIAFKTTEVDALEMGTQEVGITVTEGYVSRYIWRGQDLYADNDGAHQPSIDIAFPQLLYGTDISLNMWGSFPISKGHEIAEELDYTLTFSGNLIDMFNLSVGYTYFDFPNANDKTDVQEPWISFTLDKVPALALDISITLFAGYDFAVASGGPDNGWYYSWGLDTELPFPQFPLVQDGQTLVMGVVNWGNDGVADFKPFTLYATELSFSTSYTFTAFSITPNFHYTINYEDEINHGDEELWGGIEISYGF
jgi:hypothetical protein